MRRSTTATGFILALLLGAPLCATEASSDSTAGEEFVARAAQIALMDVELGKLAQENARATGINALGTRLARDHRRMGAVLQAISIDKGFVVPTTLDTEHRSVVNGLNGLSGAQFDAAYAALMASAHTKAIALFEQAEEGEDPELAEFASRCLPSLREHKRLAEMFVKVTAGNGSGVSQQVSRAAAP